MRSSWTALPFAAALFIAASVTANAGPLHDAVRDGDIARLQELIAAGEDLEAQDKFVGTALHWAAVIGNADASRILIEAGADVNTHARGDATTALHVAAQRGSVEVAAVLIEAGAETGARDTADITPLHLAAGNDRVSMAALLLDAGADISARGGQFGLTPLHMAARSNASGTIELLARSGVDIDEKLLDGLTPLSNAARQAQAGAVRTLLELGADVNGAPDVDPVFPSTPLEEAISRGLEEIADILRAAGATE